MSIADFDVRIDLAPPRRRYRGRRARRAAFAHSQRCGRYLRRLMREISPACHERMVEAWSDAMVYGVGWLTVGPGTPFERTLHGADERGRIRVVDTFYTSCQ